MTVKLFLTTLYLLFVLNGQDPYVKSEAAETTNVFVANSLGKFSMLGKPGQLQATFGKAIIKKEKDEVLGGIASDYTYNGFAVYFNKNNVEAIYVTKPQYKVYLDGVWIKVGDNLEKLKSRFPISYKNRDLTISTHQVQIQMKSHKVLLDALISITCNTDQVITGIWIGNDNS